MSIIALNRSTFSAAVLALACATGTAQAAATATVVLDAGLLSTLGFIGASVTGTGTGVTYSAGSFAAPISSVSIADAGPSAALVTWGADASLTIANATASAVFSGFAFDAATSKITADIAFTSNIKSATYADVGFLNVTGTSGSLSSVLASATPVSISYNGSGAFDLTSLTPVIVDLGVPTTVVSLLAGKEVAKVSFSGTSIVTSPVPEPATALSFLVGAGLIGGLAMRRRAK